ncbi:hypothetical protein AC579_7194 [Pseudocercospora musae]|uniref:Alpha/beta hydrolase fold-3 domain-containing protein n=1 Tax=Pseudocercospora musae TaxID=113226 RepID=A0A139I475_9PEZI|nr:hypothetical protein AC579_7194 [Pseudocercospora musae]
MDQWHQTFLQVSSSHSPVDPPVAYQPLHPTLRSLLDPEYVAFHDQFMQYVIPDDQKKWNGSARTQPSLPPGGSVPLRVSLIRDVQLENCSIRVFVPESSQPVSKYPVLLWFHGGGWAIGGLDSENDFCTYICQTSQCIVLSVNYRLAPEFPYPAAAEDAIEAFQWLFREAHKYYNVDTTRVAIGGTCAGGNLAAVLVLEAACLFKQFRPIFLLLIVPVIDNTATPGNGWYNLNAPWLTPQCMLWYRRMYLPNGHGRDALFGREDWQVSPNLAPSKLLSKCPATWIAVAEHDLLATEALAFSSQLRAAGVQTSVTVYQGSTHTILALNGVLSKGRELMLDAAMQLNGAFWPILLDPLNGWSLCS